MKRFTLLILLTLSSCTGLPAQTFSLITGREPVVSLDGLWRFHTGDNPAWASPNFDDSSWPLLRSDESWAKQGYKDWSGYAWYRFRVTVPAGLNDVSLLLPPIRTSYQVFVDGKQAGSFGQMPFPAERFLLSTVVLPTQAVYRVSLAAPSRTREVTVALRVWHWRNWSRYNGGGTLQGGGLIGESDQIATRFQLLRDARLLSTGGDYSIGILCLIAGIMATVLFLVRRKEREYIWFAINQFADALIVGVGIYVHLHTVHLLLRDTVSEGLSFVAGLSYILFLQTLLRGRRSVLFSLAIGSIVARFVIYMTLVFGFWSSVGAAGMGQAVCALALALWVFDLLMRRAKEGLPDARLLLAPVLISAALNPLAEALWAAFQLGWLPASYWPFDLFTRPFPVSADDAVEALFLIAMLAILSNRFLRSRREEQRMITELEAAHSVQSLLVPATAQNTPGFAVESVYVPAQEVGGDFFHIQHADDGSLLIVIGDVSGKGLKAAMTVSAIVGALRNERERRPAEVLRSLNRVLHGQVSGFVTCAVAFIAADGALTIANAGHLSPYRNGKELALFNGLPLGITANTSYEETHFKLAPGDRLTFISDGVVETANSRRELFGFDRAEHIIRQPAAAIADAAQRWGQEDDLTVLTVARLAPATT